MVVSGYENADPPIPGAISIRDSQSPYVQYGYRPANNKHLRVRRVSLRFVFAGRGQVAFLISVYCPQKVLKRVFHVRMLTGMFFN